MSYPSNPGAKFRAAVLQNHPLQIVGTINAYCAMLAKSAGHRAIYLSGAGVANASFGLPDLGMTSLDNVLEDAGRIIAACDLPLLVDIDTGFGPAMNITRTIRLLENAGVAAVHIEDQVVAKRCGHRPGKQIVATDEMVDRIRCAVDGRSSKDFVIMARTDAVASEGIDRAIERCKEYLAAGAEMIFAEALSSLEDYRNFCSRLPVPVLANITEFGKTPLFTTQELAAAGVAMVLYPLTAFRAMSKAALDVYQTLIQSGTQKSLLPAMQTREQLYEILGYHEYEKRLDELNARRGGEDKTNG